MSIREGKARRVLVARVLQNAVTGSIPAAPRESIMRNRGWQSYRRGDSSPKLSVVVVEDEGELVGLVMDPSQPPVRIRLGQLPQPSHGAAGECR
jgi:hypothetical protein